jgi:hypothetical protein
MRRGVGGRGEGEDAAQKLERKRWDEAIELFVNPVTPAAGNQPQ